MKEQKQTKTCGHCAYAYIEIANSSILCTCDESPRSGKEIGLEDKACACFRTNLELKSCPFCGDAEPNCIRTEEDEYRWGGWFVRCTGRECGAEVGPYETHGEAIAAWNRRTNNETKETTK